MPDGLATKSSAKAGAKVKPEKTRNDKARADRGRADRRSDGIFTRIVRFVRESYIEVVKKAAWPTWSELKKFTAVVILAVLIVGIWIGGLDFVLTQLTKAVGLMPHR